MKIKQLGEYFIPEKYVNDEELSRKSRFIIWFVYIATIIGVFFWILMYLQNPNDLTGLLTVAFFLPLNALGLFLFRKKGSFIFSSHFFCGIFFLVMTFQPLTTGGIFSPDMPTIYIIPIFAMIMGNIRIGLFYAFVSLLVLIGYLVLGFKDTAHYLGLTTKLTPDYFFFNLALNMMVILFLVFRNENLRLKILDKLRVSNRIISEKSKEVTDSITYAKRIQAAILPEDRVVKNLLPDSFVLYLPKDIVSGDFYWITEKNGFQFLAIADCTGHGVPGALMSVIGVNQLNTSVQEKAIVNPSGILEELDKNVSKILNQNKNEIRDGMDIAILKINLKDKSLEFASANRPLYYVKNKTLTEIKPSKFPVGGIEFDKEKKFESVHLQLQEGDMVYLSTDGYADQFGGEKNKKITTKKIKSMLESISAQQLSEQEQYLLEFFNTYKTGYEQTDDVLIAGIRF
jgi:serine phosphatase RsbU (regulator of sigma subunit)